jgi:exopolyphosphatase / guanosine-5'-triphosphate,3'-diphosphate pyrophosphatase
MEKMMTLGAETLLAAVDLGSNSFRLEIAHHVGGQIQRVDYLKEAVRQGGDLDENRNLNAAALERGIKCLERFGERLKGFPKQNVRAVATQTLREARNRDFFLGLARKALGYNIEVISGVEEARLIYQGVSHFLPQSDERRLVIDIGGRSTEFVLGQHFNTLKTESLRVGSVAWSLKYFPDGELSERNLKRAEVAAESFLDVITESYGPQHWDVAYGASGTVGAVGEMLALAGFKAGVITMEGLDWLRRELIKAKNVNRLRLDGLKEERNAVIGGGLSVLRAAFDILNIDTLHVARGALRHGLFYDMAAEASDGLVYTKEASVNLLLKRFPVDTRHADNVKEAAMYLFDSVAADLTLKKTELKEQARLLAWAAQCHEIGSIISHAVSHLHGAYILDHTELMGFSQSELHHLGMLVLGQRGKIRKLDLTMVDNRLIISLACLRLAVILCHSRNRPDLNGIKKLQYSEEGLQLTVLDGWLEAHPQSAYLLEEEVIAWKKTNWRLAVTIETI